MPFDPVRLRYLEALARRAQDHNGSVRRLLDDKLAVAQAVYDERHAQSTNAAFTVQRPTSAPQPSALAELTQTLNHSLTQHTPKNAPADTGRLTNDDGHGSGASLGARPELKSIRYFRETWSKLSVDKQIMQALEQGPENAGPLNSHQLVLRSLSAMRDLSPAYLNRFMSYADALLCLDQANNKPVAKSAPDGESGKKRIAGRARVR